jgi:hypothetical protein
MAKPSPPFEPPRRSPAGLPERRDDEETLAGSFRLNPVIFYIASFISHKVKITLMPSIA